jgi:hypothetical protein
MITNIFDGRDKLDNRKRPVHKGVKTFYGIFNQCNDRCDSSKYSLKWEEVTCKRCLAKRRGPYGNSKVSKSTK